MRAIILVLTGAMLSGCTWLPTDCASRYAAERAEEVLHDSQAAAAQVYVGSVRDIANQYFLMHESAETVTTDELIGASLMSDSLRLDPWGVAYRIAKAGDEVQVTSAGPDGEFGTDDDVSSEGGGGTGD